MTFILTQNCGVDIREFQAAIPLGARPVARRAENGFNLVTGSPERFREVNSGKIAARLGPLWVAVEGHIKTSYRDTGRQSSTEIVAKILRESDDWTLLSRLKGHFVILVVAPRSRRVTLIRDPLGARTAFFANAKNALAIAGQSHLITQLPQFHRDVDPSFIASMFNLVNEPPRGHSPFRDVHELEPGERVDFIQMKAQHHRRTWPHSISTKPKRPSEWVDEFRFRFRNAVESCISPNERPCVMLSGGLDSSPTAAVAARKLSSQGKQLGAVSFYLKSFPEADESQYIEETAQHINAKLITFNADDLLSFRNLDESIIQPDTPLINFFRPCINQCYAAASRHGYNVILNGNAGDFLYPTRQWALHDAFRRLEFRQVLDKFKLALHQHGFISLHKNPSVRFVLRELLKRPPGNPRKPNPWLTAKANQALSLESEPPEVSEHPSPSYARKLLGTLISLGTACENTVAETFGLERRDPFIDEDLVALFLDLPFSMSHRNGTTKWVMREAMRKDSYLPETVRTKPRTGLLSTFLDASFEQNKAGITDFLFREHTAWQEWIDPIPVQRAVSDHQDSFRDRALAALSIGYCLWLEKIKHLPKIPTS